MQVTVQAYIRQRCDYSVGTDGFIQTFSLRKDAQGFPSVCGATGAALKSQLSNLVGSALEEAHRRTSGKQGASTAAANRLQPVIDPYAGRKFDFVH